MKTKKRALGRGLDAILQSPESDLRSKEIAQNYVVGAIANVDIETIEANPFQPRNNFEDDGLQELANSIRQQGIVQPITVRKIGFNKFQLISGERRLRAAKLAGLKEIPSYLRVANDEQMLEMALIENIHRKDLNPLEIASSYHRLVEECSLTHETLSERVGKKRATITNYMRLLKLPAEVQIALRDEKISMGHARALINIYDADLQLRLLRKIIQQGLSVRQVESLARNTKSTSTGTPSDTSALQTAILPKQNLIARKLNAMVSIKINNKGKGNIVIPFGSTEELDRLVEELNN